MAFTYTTLTQAIQDYTQNDETTFVANIDNFIQAAEERILKQIDLEYFRTNSSGAMTANNKYLQIPSDYLSSFSLSFIKATGEQVFLLQKDVNFVQDFNPDPTVTGEPRFYAEFDIGNFILGPTPDDSYLVEMHYFYRPQSITAAATGTTWLGDNAPNTLLYGSLMEAYTFMKGEPDMLQLYNTRLQESLQGLAKYAITMENNDAYRQGLVIRPPQP